MEVGPRYITHIHRNDSEIDASIGPMTPFLSSKKSVMRRALKILSRYFAGAVIGTLVAEEEERD
jgi:hypothetical protein